LNSLADTMNAHEQTNNDAHEQTTNVTMNTYEQTMNTTIEPTPPAALCHTPQPMPKSRLLDYKGFRIRLEKSVAASLRH
jgi:hypothetical protein